MDYAEGILSYEKDSDEYYNAIANVVLGKSKRAMGLIARGVEPRIAIGHYEAEWELICDEIDEQDLKKLVRMDVERNLSLDEDSESDAQDIEVEDGIEGV